MKIFEPEVNSPAGLDVLGTAIAAITKNQIHIGILFRGPDNHIKFLHLEWHHRLKCEPPRDNFLWLQSPLDEPNRDAIAAYCELVAEKGKNDQIPYGIDLDGSGFDPDTGKFDSSNEYAGLTCASFVIQIYRALRIPLVDLSNWPARKNDRNWQRSIIARLEESGRASSEHISKQKDLLGRGVARFKPEEVASAVAMKNPPHSRNDVRHNADRLRNLAQARLKL